MERFNSNSSLSFHSLCTFSCLIWIQVFQPLFSSQPYFTPKKYWIWPLYKLYVIARKIKGREWDCCEEATLLQTLSELCSAEDEPSVQILLEGREWDLNPPEELHRLLCCQATLPQPFYSIGLVRNNLNVRTPQVFSTTNQLETCSNATRNQVCFTS